MKTLLLLISLANAGEHIRQNDLVKIKNPEVCLKEEAFFKQCDKVELFIVEDLLLDEYKLTPKKGLKGCESVFIPISEKDKCLEVVHIRKAF